MTSPIVFILVSLATCIFDICYGFLKNSSEYETSCNVNGTRINCMFSVSTKWSFLEFRTWLDKMEGDVTAVDLKIKCSDGGSVFLPSPYQARSLRSIQIKDCIIDGHMSESTNVTSSYSDTLSVQVFESVIFRENLKTLIERIKTPYDRSSVCGPESLVQMVSRNISQELIMSEDINLALKELMLYKEMHNENSQTNFMCTYKNLKYLEDSHRVSLSKSFFETFTGDHKYPNLTTLILNSIRMQYLPTQLKQWSAHFPSLRRLDLSSNVLSSFSFEHPEASQPFLVIDLSHNQITSVPDDLPMYLDGSPLIFVQLEGNPLHCDCKIRPLSKYLKTIRQRQKHYVFFQNILSVKCHSPIEKKGQQVMNLDFNNC